MYLERIQQVMHSLNEELGMELEKNQRIDMLMRSEHYPRALSNLSWLCKEELKETFPALSQEMQTLLSGFRTGLERAELLPVLRLAQKHNREMNKAYPLVGDQANYLTRSCGEFWVKRFSRPEAQAWLSGLLQGEVDFDDPVSQRFLSQTPEYQGVHYRGEHGELSAGVLQTKLSQYAFANKDIAKHYALNPNNRNDIVVTPRVIEAEISLYSPFSTKADAFVYFSDLRTLFDNDEEYVAFAKSKLDYFYDTDNFARVQEKFGFDDDNSADIVLSSLIQDHGPDILSEFYIIAYAVFDDQMILDKLKAQGYDGVAHLGNGESALEMEYKVFYPEQIKINKVLAVTHTKEIEIPFKETMADKYQSSLKRNLRGF